MSRGNCQYAFVPAPSNNSVVTKNSPNKQKTKNSRRFQSTAMCTVKMCRSQGPLNSAMIVISEIKTLVPGRAVIVHANHCFGRVYFVRCNYLPLTFRRWKPAGVNRRANLIRVFSQRVVTCRTFGDPDIPRRSPMGQHTLIGR